MPDKDRFTSHDKDDSPAYRRGDRDASSEAGLSDDDLPETDFSTLFPEGEHSMEEPEQDEPVATVARGAHAKTRLLPLLLLLVIVGAAGAYFFMDLGGSTSVPTVVVPAQPGTKSLPLPPPPAPVPVDQSQVEPAAKNVTVAVPPPPSPVEEDAKPQESTGSQSADLAVAEPSASVPVAATAPQDAALQPEPPPASDPPAAAKAVTLLPQAEDGAYALDAGSYLLESNRKALVEKIKQLGYEPLVTPLDATLNMTRLRLGTFSKNEVQEALALARTIEPGSYSMPAGEGYVIYAGTFLKRDNVDKLSRRFATEGIKVYAEPVQVVRTLSRVRFGRFATREDALAASREVGAVGLQAEVVKAK